MMDAKKIAISLLLLAGLALIATGCGTQVVTQEVPVEVTRQVVVTEIVEVTPEGPMEPMEPAVEVPFEAMWAGSGHADAEAEAFVHWDEDDPPVVPTACAKCHSTPGHLDFLGADGTAFGVVDNDQPVGTVIECQVCHNDVALTLTSVVMPSGIEITGLGDEARCMQCHQGRQSTISVNESIASAGVDDDTVSEDLGFLNIHYYAAAASKYGTLAKGGYEYEGKTYDGNFAHVDAYDNCIECHNPHTLELRINECSLCHTDVSSVEDLRDVRMFGSLVDYDGDGDVDEGVFYELEGLREMLLQAIQAYANETPGAAIAYSSAAYPYFFNDTNADGTAGDDEANFGNRYVSWTPRLLRAAYNYQVSLKDPGAYAHGGKYIIQLMYDSIEDLNTVISSPVDLSSVHRIDAGHFAGSEEAFRHWDEDLEVPGRCSRCHSAEGLPLFLTQGVTINQHLPNGMNCANCHDDVSVFTRYAVEEVSFPSGAVLTLDDSDSNLCLACHQGRESTVSVNGLIGDLPVDEVSDSLRFLNIHYFAAGATRFGTEAKGAYEYAGKEYVGFFEHVPAFRLCTDCHDGHGLWVQVDQCGTCHPGVESEEDLDSLRIDPTDWDGDGDTTEGIRGEVNGMRDALYAALQQYANDTVGTAIGYTSARYPYFFVDANGDGTISSDEADRYNTWTPRLLQAAYNYQYVSKDPGGFAHNGKYVIQVVYDSIEDLGGDVSGMTRP